MRLVNIEIENQSKLGFERQGKIFVFDDGWAVSRGVPTTMIDAILRGREFFQVVDPILNVHIKTGETHEHVTVYSAEEVQYGPAVPYGKKIICVGLNYKKHAEESKMELPKYPLLFSKFDNTLIGHNNLIKKPFTTEKLDYEAEIGIIIGRRAQKVSVESALDHVYGLTIANDVSARDLQFVTSQWLLGKSCDGFCPTGPFLVTIDEVSDLNQIQISCKVNGEVRQSASTAQMIFPFKELISYISQYITLEPGDLILSGTPDGVIFGLPEEEQVWLQPGDEIIVEVETLGCLRTVIG